MQILVIGSGGREHALLWKLSQSPLVKKLYIAPGNAGTDDIATSVTLNNDHDIVTFCKEHRIDLVCIGPEAPLVNGLSDILRKENIAVFGPSKKAAQLEGSKAFTKYICDTYHIPTANYQQFTDCDKALDYIKNINAPIVIKADGLAAGKGVTITESRKEAAQILTEILVEKKFGAAGQTVIIEEFLQGEEISFFALCDGHTAIALGSVQDHKTAYEGNTGPNTGGMGTYAPAPIATAAREKEIMEKIIFPTLEGLKKEGIPYQGVLFAGLMITPSGIKLLEYNIRFGDPETQVLMSRLKSDLVPLLLATNEGNLDKVNVELYEHAALCVVMATKGYPGPYKNGSIIENLEEASHSPHTIIFHAGTKRNQNGVVTAHGGRVLGITGTGKTITEAYHHAYTAVDKIHWQEGFFRRDIGKQTIKK